MARTFTVLFAPHCGPHRIPNNTEEVSYSDNEHIVQINEHGRVVVKSRGKAVQMVYPPHAVLSVETSGADADPDGGRGGVF